MASSASELRPEPVGRPDSGRRHDPLGAGASRRPVIGITTYLEQAQTGVWDVRAAFLPEVYLQGVTDAGGIAVLLPPQPVDDRIADRVLDSLDGLVLSGGADIDPALYGQDAHAETGAPRVDRDTWERALLRRAIARRMPFLGICRGAQMLNVALGGTLHQHLPDVVGTDRYRPAPAEFGPIPVRVAADTRLADILGRTAEDLTVQCYHHQAIDRLADGLAITARSGDGVIEAVELADVPFGVAVQWHPEQDAADRRLFHALVAAARDGGGSLSGPASGSGSALAVSASACAAVSASMRDPAPAGSSPREASR